jgi:hypothetical protein
MVSLRKDLLPGFRGYDIPAVTLKQERVPLQALAKIFETINRTGVRLDTFDLMVAKLFPHGFFLRDEWQAVLDRHEGFGRFRIDGLEALRLIALREHLRQRDAEQRISVKGIRQSDVLNLTPDVVKAEWEGATEALQKALDFFLERGVVRRQLIPAPAMLLPLADILWSGSTRPGFEMDLQRWFWASAFSQTYAQGANTQVVADARALRAWGTDELAVPAAVSSFSVDRDDLLDERRRNEMLTRGLSALLVARDARDWITDERLKDVPLEVDLEYHHVFPDKYLVDRGIDPHIVSNYAVLTKSTNAALRNDPPADVLERTTVKKSAIQSHAVDLEAMEVNNWRGFLERRVLALTDLMEEAVGK